MKIDLAAVRNLITQFRQILEEAGGVRAEYDSLGRLEDGAKWVLRDDAKNVTPRAVQSVQVRASHAAAVLGLGRVADGWLDRLRHESPAFSSQFWDTLDDTEKPGQFLRGEAGSIPRVVQASIHYLEKLAIDVENDALRQELQSPPLESPTKIPTLKTIAFAAKALNVSRDQIERMIHKKEIQAIKIGKRGWRIPLSEIVRLSNP